MMGQFVLKPVDDCLVAYQEFVCFLLDYISTIHDGFNESIKENGILKGITNAAIKVINNLKNILIEI